MDAGRFPGDSPSSHEESSDSDWAYRPCAGCGQRLHADQYSNNQWAKAVGTSRCKLCVQECVPRDSTGFGTARENNATRAEYGDLDSPYAEGTFRYVQLGKYTGGARTGQACVCKWFKSGGVYEATFFDTELAVVAKTLELLAQWNGHGFITETVRLNSPEVWPFKASQGPTAAARRGQLHLVEPYSEGFRKFNSNTGWTSRDGSDWDAKMQALSHWSYHATAGQFLLCDLQGGVYRDGAILTDPVVQSRSRGFGPTDLGPEGISTFFAGHTCNAFCRPGWNKPRDTQRYYSATKASWMATTSTAPAARMQARGMGEIYEHEQLDDDDGDSDYSL